MRKREIATWILESRRKSGTAQDTCDKAEHDPVFKKTRKKPF